MTNIKFDFDVTAFNEAMRKTTRAFENFGRVFARVQAMDVAEKKAKKANSRRLRYTLKAHSR